MKLYLPALVLLWGAVQTQVSLGQDDPLFGPPPIEEAEAVAVPAPEQANSDEMSSGYGVTTTRVSKPYTPYPAGLSWMPTPQPFRVPIVDRILYPPHTYVRRCPYYPRGYYWGANWNRRMLGGENLLFCGKFRYNPYWTAAKASHRPKLKGLPYFAPPPGPEGQAMLLGVSAPPPRLHGHGPRLGERREMTNKVAKSDKVGTSPRMGTSRNEPTKVAKSQKKAAKAVSRSSKSVVTRKPKTAQARR